MSTRLARVYSLIQLHFYPVSSKLVTKKKQFYEVAPAMPCSDFVRYFVFAVSVKTPLNNIPPRFALAQVDVGI